MKIASIKAVYVELPTQLYPSAHAKELSKHLGFLTFHFCDSNGS